MYKNFSDKCNLSVKENIFHAKKIMSQNIYNSAKLEGCNVTFPETETILSGVNVSGVSIGDIECILNLRSAWRFLIKTIVEPLTLDYICKIHENIARNQALEWGKVRTGRVSISGTTYIPPIPVKEDVENKLNEILKLPTVTSQAIYYFLWAARSQLFWDGNKRTSTLIANKILISAGRGLFTVKEADLLEFNKHLSAYYDEGDFSQIDDFIFENCIIHLLTQKGGIKLASLSKEELLAKRKQYIKEKTLCSVCQKELSYEITDKGQPICITCFMKGKNITPAMEKSIAENSKGIPKLFAYKAFIKDKFRCKECGVILSQFTARPARKETTSKKLLQIKDVQTSCPDCLAHKKIDRSKVIISEEIVKWYIDYSRHNEPEKAEKALRNMLTQSVTLFVSQGDIRVYKCKPYTIYIQLFNNEAKIIKMKSTQPKKEPVIKKVPKKIKQKVTESVPKKAVVKKPKKAEHRRPVNTPELVKQLHEKYKGICQECGQRIDRKVGQWRQINKRLPVSIDNTKLICPDCKKGIENPAIKGLTFSEEVLNEVVQKTKLSPADAGELLKTFAFKYALVDYKFNGKLRYYWSWKKECPINTISVKRSHEISRIVYSPELKNQS